MKFFLAASAIFLSAVAGFGGATYMFIQHGFVSAVGFVPKTCWYANILVVNRSGRRVDELVIRENEVVLWRGFVADSQGGCIPQAARAAGSATIQATWSNGIQLIEIVEGGFVANREQLHLVLIEPSSIRHIPYLGGWNQPLGSVLLPDTRS